MATESIRDIVERRADAIGPGALSECDPLEGVGAEFRVLLDDIDPHICSLDEFAELISCAPTPLAKGYLLGILRSRRMIAAVTGRPMK